MTTENYYTLLEVSSSSTKKEILESYRKMKKIAEHLNAHTLCLKLELAFNILYDEHSRKEYDNSISTTIPSNQYSSFSPAKRNKTTWYWISGIAAALFIVSLGIKFLGVLEQPYVSDDNSTVASTKADEAQPEASSTDSYSISEQIDTSSPSPANAVVPTTGESDVKFIFQDIPTELNHSPITINGHLMLPVEEMANLFDAERSSVEPFQWDNDQKTFFVYYFVITAKASLDSKTAYSAYKSQFEDGATFTLDVSPMMVNDTLYAPLQFFSEGLGAEIYWDEEEKELRIYIM
ncbi:stalk domain-containing protein [Paenibacillus sp. MMO-58]|uniref:stalk domain-containing protein n=1 Tax=Paenibacillus sp. MMO-58 TaxID=3081290 RepID=UPI00301AB5C5